MIGGMEGVDGPHSPGEEAVSQSVYIRCIIKCSVGFCMKRRLLGVPCSAENRVSNVVLILSKRRQQTYAGVRVIILTPIYFFLASFLPENQRDKTEVFNSFSH